MAVFAGAVLVEPLAFGVALVGVALVEVALATRVAAGVRFVAAPRVRADAAVTAFAAPFRAGLFLAGLFAADRVAAALPRFAAGVVLVEGPVWVAPAVAEGAVLAASPFAAADLLVVAFAADDRVALTMRYPGSQFRHPGDAHDRASLA